MVGKPGHIYEEILTLELMCAKILLGMYHVLGLSLPSPAASALSSQRSDLHHKLEAYPALPCFFPLSPFIGAIA